jgi:iron complex outermembrane receptor protein
MAGRRAEVLSTGALLSQVPGAVVNSTGGLGQSIPLNGPGDIADISLVPPAILERAEVLRGSASASYGPLALGGVVNLVTRRPEDVAPVFGDFTAGSFGTFRGSLGLSGAALGGTGLVLLHGAYSEGDFPYTYQPLVADSGAVGQQLVRQNNQATSGGGLAKEGWNVSGWALDALLEGDVLARGLAGTEDNPTPDAEQTASRLLAALRAQHTFSSGLLLALRLDGRRTTDNLTGGTFGAGEFDRLWQADATADASVTLGQHALGATASVGVAEVHATGGSPTWALTTLTLKDEWLLWQGRASLVGVVGLDQAGPFAAVSPKLGASVTLPVGFSVRGNAGYGFRPPSFQELYLPTGTLGVNPNLQPERSFSVDGALLYANRWASGSVGGFWTRYQDLITYEYYPPFFARPQNISVADAWGMEAEARLRPWSWFDAEASYTLQQTENLRDVAPYYGKPLPYRPAQLGWVRLAAGPDWLQARVDVRGRSSVTVNRAAVLMLPGHVFVGAGLDVVLWNADQRRISLSVQVSNIFNVQGQDLDGYPLPGRAVFATLALALGEANPKTAAEGEAPR